MRLKQIKLAGFKSFVDPTQVPFPTAMTCVVGPNGCGKSNVIDAVRWVLGESSAKNLRGDAMTDVIFNGSTQRKPVSQASVELMFENTAGVLQGSLADRSEISLKRLVSRDGQSLYFLNGSKCRRRDITDIFLGTGLGPRSYAIIEQGMISRLIESRPQDLRVFLEEAAGISKYKERRRETETRMSHTRDNLSRLADVRDELSKNLDKLRRQATVAERYKELKATERRLKAELTGLKWWQYNQQLQQAEQQLQQLETEYEACQSQGSGAMRQLLELKAAQQTEQDALQQSQQQYYQLGADISSLEQQLLHQRQRRQNVQEELRQLELNLQHQLDLQQAEQQQLLELEQQLLELAPELELLQQQHDAASDAFADAEAQGQQLQHEFQRWQQQSFQQQQREQQLQLKSQHSAQQLAQYQQQQQRLQQQLQELSATESSAELQQAQQQQQQLQQVVAQCKQTLAAIELQLSQLQQQQLQQQLAQQQLQLSLQGKQQQQRQLQQQHQQLIAEQPLLPQLQIKQPWQVAVAVALQALNFSELPESAPSQTPAAHYLLPVTASAHADPHQAFVLNSANGAAQIDAISQLVSLASQVSGALWPDYFQRVFCVASFAQAQQLAPWLKPGYSLICAEGYWLGANWGIKASAQQRDNPVTVSLQLQNLTQDIALNEQQLVEQNIELTQTAQQLSQSEQQQKLLKQQLQQNNQQWQAADTKVQLIQQQQLQQQQRQQQLHDELTQLVMQQQQAEAALATWQAELATLAPELLDHAQQATDWQQQQQHAQQQLLQWRAKVQQVGALVQQQQLQQVSLERQLEAARLHLRRTQAQQQQLQERVRTLTSQRDLLDEPAADEQAQLLVWLAERQQLEQQKLVQQQQLQQIEQQIKQLELGQHGVQQQLQARQKTLEHLRIEAEGYRVRANNMLELLQEQQVNFTELIADLPEAADERLWQQQLDKTIEAVAKLGPINLAAIDEFTQQEQRKNYLDQQNDDLVAALDTLEGAIRKIDRETRQKFKQTFDQVNQGLQTLFPKVFGGGNAYLELTDDDLLETGVSIMARPPGKKNSTIHLLSGGEKALTALSLVFSIFRLNPAPFCMLDEVDAPLDDANVGRFCNLVREMSESVQFIYISHNKIAMEMAQQLMGVTMQEPGVSRVVAVDVEDAMKMAQA